MKNLDLSNYGVVEMDAMEMKKVDGGCWEIIALGLAACTWAYEVGKDCGGILYDYTH